MNVHRTVYVTVLIVDFNDIYIILSYLKSYTLKMMQRYSVTVH